MRRYSYVFSKHGGEVRKMQPYLCQIMKPVSESECDKGLRLGRE